MPTQRSSLNREYDYEADERRRAPERRAARRTDSDAADREISLGTGTILGIFFALALTCGVFFAFGYQMGRKSSQAALAVNAGADAGTDSDAATSGSKPSAISPLQAAENLFSSKATSKQTADADKGSADTDAPDTDSPSSTRSARQTVFETAPASGRSTSATRPLTQTPAEAQSSQAAELGGRQSRTPAPRSQEATLVRTATEGSSGSAAATQNAAAAQPLPAATGTGTFIVQVAAVSHQEDAELLDSALKQRGYAVFVRQEAQDHLLHVQVGPFATRRDADLIRQRLLADGYNALLK